MTVEPVNKWIWNRLGTKLFFSEITGDYDAESNPKGWGAPNEARSDYAIVPYVRYMKSDQGIYGQELNYAGVSYDESSATTVEFEIDLIDDGWHYLTMFYLPYVQTTENHLYWDTNTKQIMQKKAGGDVAITKSQVLALPDEYKPVMVDSQDIWQPKLAILWKVLDDEYTEALINNQSRDKETLKQKLDEISRLMVAADYRWRSAVQAEAQKIVEQLIEIRDNYYGE